MAKRGKAPPPTEREVNDFFRTLNKYGFKELTRWRTRYQKSKRKRGRRQFDPDENFLAVMGDWFASVPRSVRLKFIADEWQLHKEQSEDRTLVPAARRAWEPHRSLGGGTVDSIERRLMRKAKRVKKKARKI